MRGNQATSYDPLRMLTGGGQNFVQQGYGQRAAMFGIPQEQVTRINPDAGVNIGMQEYANRANYLANTYAAKEQAAAGAASGLWGLGSLGGGCYKADSPKVVNLIKANIMAIGDTVQAGLMRVDFSHHSASGTGEAQAQGEPSVWADTR